MRCKKCINLFADYLDKTMDDYQVIAIEEHLKKCPGCSEELEFLKKYHRAVSSIPVEKAPENFLDMVHEKIEAQDKQVEKEGIIRKLFFPLKIKIPLEAAGVLALTVIVALVYNPFKQAKLPMEQEVEEKTFEEKSDSGLVDMKKSISPGIARKGEKSLKDISVDETDDVPIARKGSREGDADKDLFYSKTSAKKEDITDNKNAQQPEAARKEAKIYAMTLTHRVIDGVISSKDKTDSATVAVEKTLEKKAVKEKSVTGSSGAGYSSKRASKSSPSSIQSETISMEKKSSSALVSLTARYSGKITSSSRSGTSRIFTILIPADKYDSFIKSLGQYYNVKKGFTGTPVQSKGTVTVQFTVK